MYAERGREEIKLCQREREEEKISLLSLLPPNSLVIFIHFYWLIFNTIFILIFHSSFYFILSLAVSSFVIFALFILFCHGDGYKHTPSWHVLFQLRLSLCLQRYTPIKITGKKTINIILTFFHYYGCLLLKFWLGFCMGVHFILMLP